MHNYVDRNVFWNYSLNNIVRGKISGTKSGIKILCRAIGILLVGLFWVIVWEYLLDWNDYFCALVIMLLSLVNCLIAATTIIH